MWDDVVKWLLAVLATAASGGLLVGRSTHTLRRLKAEADLLPLIPSGPAKTDLAAHVEASVTRYLQSQELWTRVRTQSRIMAGLFVMSTAIALAVLVVQAVTGESRWTSGAVVAAAGLSTVGTFMLVRLMFMARAAE